MSKAPSRNYDLLVVGGTPGGIACAVRAAREGLTVLLVQHNRHLGGMLTNGLMQWDALYGGFRSPIFNETALRIEEYYRDTFGQDSPEYQAARFTQQHYPMSRFEPKVAEDVLTRLVTTERNLHVLLGHIPIAVKSRGAQIVTVDLVPYAGGTACPVEAKIFVDATYEGDLAAMAGVPFRVGREGRDEYAEPHAGKIFTNILRQQGPRDALGGKLNLHPYGHVQGSIDPESPQIADAAIQAFNFRFCLTNDPATRKVPEAPPPNYDRADYLNFNRKGMAAGRINGKATFNSPILPGENHRYPEAAWPGREIIAARHRDFALGLMYFLQNDESIPPEEREHYRTIGLAGDEFTDNGNIPYEMYVREARRIVGCKIFTQHDNMLSPHYGRAPIQGDAIAITDWAMDSHDCTRDRREGYDFDGKLILTEESRPAQIPWSSLLSTAVENLIVPVCLSATHVAWGAVRLEPVWMQVGEAAGVAAALCACKGVPPLQLDPDALQRELIGHRFALTFFNDLDASDPDLRAPVAQYFGTKGFFPDYFARPHENVSRRVAGLWREGAELLRTGRLDPQSFAMRVKEAEEEPEPVYLEATRVEFLHGLWK